MNEGFFHRPKFHFTARKNWINDPNGCVFYEGEWHLFFQHNPRGLEMGSQSWGHAISRDLVRWQELAPAILPDELGNIYSGSAVVDWNNSAGFQEGNRPALVAAFTHSGHLARPHHPYTQCLAYSQDFGRTWTKYGSNPVIHGAHGEPDRDPKIFWHAERKYWVMALYVEKAERKAIALFVSHDLKRWRETQRIEGFYECPELFPLTLPSNPMERIWVLQDASSHYVVGSFDGERFEPIQEKRRLDYGPNYYAGQNFNEAPEGRCVQIAWMAGGKYPDAPFNQQMSFPCELTLDRDAKGYFVRRRFIRELDGFAQPVVAAEAACKLTPFLLRLEFASSRAQVFAMTIMGTLCHFDFIGGEVRIGDFKGPLPLSEAIQSLEVLVDETSAEFLFNAGEIGVSCCLVPVPDADSFEVAPALGRVEVRALRLAESV